MTDTYKQLAVETAIGGNLHVWPRAMITERILQSIRTMKSSLIEFLEQYEERAAIMEFDAGIKRQEAEAAAYADVSKIEVNR